MSKFFKVIIFLFLISATVSGQDDKDYSKTLKKMFKVSGTEDTYQAAIMQMIVLFKQQYPSVGADIWDSLEKEFLNSSLNDLTEMLVPVYEKYISIEDLEEVINFYKTDAGKKLALYNPLIVQESMQIGQQWGEKIGRDFVEKMIEKGY